MGVEESKFPNPSKRYDQVCHSYSHVMGRQWTLIHNCRFDIWKKSHSEQFNFPNIAIECPYSKPYECTHSFCLSRQNIINLNQKSSSFQLRKEKKQSKIAEHFEYNHIPAHLSSVQNLHFKSILCTRNGLAIVHLARNPITQFGVLDMHIHKFLGTFGRQSVKYSPDSVAAQISPDGSWCLIRLPWSRNNRVTTLQLYSLRTRDLIIEVPLTSERSFPSPLHTLSIPNHHSILPTWCEEVLTSDYAQGLNFLNPVSADPLTEPSIRALGGFNSASSVLFDFDPRFLNARIVIANVHISRGKSVVDFFDAQKSILSLVRLPTWQRLAQTMNFGVVSVSPPSRDDAESGINSRRRRSFDFSHSGTGGSNTNTNISAVGRLNILKVFYSRAGHLIFAVVSTTYCCRCNYVHSLFPSSSSSVVGRSSSPLGAISSANSSPFASSSSSSQQQRLRYSGGHRLLDTFDGVTQASPTSSGISLRPPLHPPPPGCISLFLAVFNSDTLEHLRVIRFDRPICPLHTCPTNYVPMMSKCGSRIALITMPNKRDSFSNSVRGPQAKTTKRMANSNVEGLTFTNLSNQRHVSSVSARSHQMMHSWTNGQSERSAYDAESSVTSSVEWHDNAELTRAGSRRRRRNGGSILTRCTDNELTSSTMDSVFVYRLEPPPTLQAIARQKIRQFFPDSMLEHLGLPPGIVAFLNFKPSFSCSGSCLSRSESSNLTVRSNSQELF